MTYSKPGPSGFITLFVQNSQSNLPHFKTALWRGPKSRNEPGTDGSSGRDTDYYKPPHHTTPQICAVLYKMFAKKSLNEFGKLGTVSNEIVELGKL